MNIVEVYIDGASRSNPGHAGIGVYVRITDESGSITTAEYGRYIGEATNNEAEYKALLSALSELATWSKYPKEASITIYSDSALVVNQVNYRWQIRDIKLRPLCLVARKLLLDFDNLKLIHIPREENTKADKLANEAINRKVG